MSSEGNNDKLENTDCLNNIEIISNTDEKEDNGEEISNNKDIFNDDNYSSEEETQNNNTENNNLNSDSSNSNENTTTTSNSELIQQLQTLNLSIGTIYVILIAIFLNLEYVYGERLKILDALNGTKCSENQTDKGDNPRISNRLFLYATAIFLIINWQGLQKVSQSNDNTIEGIKNKKRAYNSFFASLLIFIATLISGNNFNL